MTDAGDALAPGTRLEEFEIEEVLGAGGFGVTYLARDLSPLAAWRAVKEYMPRDWGTRRGDGTIGPRTGANAEDYGWGLERFLEEARILSRFKHPNIVHVYQVFEARGTAYMVTEYVEGRTLSAEVKKAGPLSESRVREVLAALTDGLSAVHASGLLHRDIKPANVMVREDGTPVLIDFGAARQAMGRHSRSVTALLTPGYAPIEQYSARGNQGPWTDIYALGAVAYFALGGGVPEDATERVPEDRLPSLSAAAPGRVSGELASAVDAALAVDRRDRPQSLAAWSALLAGSVEHGERRSRRAGTGESRDRESRRDRSREGDSTRRWWLAGAGATALAGAVLVAALAGPWQGTVSDDEGDETRVVEDTATSPSGEPEDGAVVEGESGGEAGGGETAAVVDEGVVDEGVAAEERSPSPSAVEEALGLDRAARRVIQEGLAASGLDAGAADGLFGPGTRRALREWQAASGVTATGYVDASAAAALRVAAEDGARVAAQRQAEREAERRRPGRVFQDCDACPEMVVMADGRLAMGRYEVTVGEYRAFASATGGGAGGGCTSLGDGDSWRDPGFPQSDRHPVVCVSWEDAQEYVSWLSRRTDAAYRLPTEEEWEGAAAGSQPACDRLGRGSRPEGTCPVGLYGLNAAGLSDMVGNSWELTSDCWDGDCGRRVSRGGSWLNVAELLRPGARFNGTPGFRYNLQGFRVSRTLD